MPYEISFILSATEATFCFVENAVQLRKILNLLDKLPQLKTLIVMDREFTSSQRDDLTLREGVEVLLYQNLIDEGRALLNDRKVAQQIEQERKQATLKRSLRSFSPVNHRRPKGVMLTHHNFCLSA